MKNVQALPLKGLIWQIDYDRIGTSSCEQIVGKAPWKQPNCPLISSILRWGYFYYYLLSVVMNHCGYEFDIREHFMGAEVSLPPVLHRLGQFSFGVQHLSDMSFW